MKINKDKALKIILNHGFKDPYASTTCFPEINDPQCKTSFYVEVGNKDAYTISEVKRWLGY
jgi:hypothetical protein